MKGIDECVDSLIKLGNAIKDFNNSFQCFGMAVWRFDVLCMIDEYMQYLEKVENSRGVKRLWFRFRALMKYRKIVRRLKNFYR